MGLQKDTAMSFKIYNFASKLVLLTKNILLEFLMKIIIFKFFIYGFSFLNCMESVDLPYS